MRRDRLLRRLALIALTATAFATVPPTTGTEGSSLASSRKGPNVLIIITDDQRARGTLSVMPSVRAWFGEAGVRFDEAFATTPTCCPSRASIFTGMYAHNHGVLTSQQGQADNLDQSKTVQHLLRGSGYRTALFGKYLNGWDIKEPPPDFDRYGVITEQPRYYYRNGEWNVNGSIRRVSTYSTVFISGLARRFVRASEKSDEQPWMMVVALTAPHSPSTPQRRDRWASLPAFKITPAMKEKDRSDKPAFVRDEGPSRAQMRARRAGQLRSLMSVDRMLAGLRRILVSTGELRDTLAIFMSDNGLMWGEHALAGKGVAYEPAVRIPLFVSWPGRVAGGSRDDRLVANVDIAPTIYDATGISPDFSVDGRSLLGTFERDRILLEHWERADRKAPNWAAHRTEGYKYIETYAADHLVPEWREYYDLGKDGWELNNPLSPAYVGTNPDPTRLRADLVCAGTEGPTACP